MINKLESRREFLKQASFAAAIPLIAGCGVRADVGNGSDGELLAAIKRNAIHDNRNEWWGAADAPSTVSSRAVISTAADRSDRLAVRGTIYQRDGKTPAPNVLIYLYHTDAHGIYGRQGEHRHGRYRGWILTDDRGRYEFDSIVPASYPNSTQSKHIHMTITGQNFREDWYDSFLFEGDRFLTDRERSPQRGGFNHVLKLEKQLNGIFRGVRDIRLL